ncbi:putative E3 ubiquitin-protein ligase [Halotydeus destructor]|nr:putative E3 ubiquitin-protein ligase [Halotydeus destructor]
MASKKKEKETTQTPKLDRVESEVSLNDTGGSGWHCVVCCQKVPGPSRRELYAIGHCDHVVCYECSTKMRVLCQQNECPICRQDIPKVIFTPNKSLKFAAIDMNKFTVVNKAHQIHFESESAERAYSTLLEHRCKLCRKESGSLKELDTHLRREHELYLCELCTDNLKVFTHERKYYNRKDLARHRRNGDPEDTSHRGHPLCQFCDVRYMDDESLHLHLRRDHYYCHFCDPLGLKQFYDTYDHLRDHFKHEHYLCEEGPCRDEKFTTVFKSDIDLQAHRVEVHCVTKTDAKQARILSLDFSYKPRSGAVGGQGAPTASIHHQPFRQFPGQRKAKPPVVDDVDSDSEPLLAANAMQEVPRAEDFPSLGPAQKASATVVARPRNYAMSSAGPKPEDFPSLPSAPLPSSASSSKMRQTQSYASNAHKSKDLVQNRKVKPQTREPGFTARPAGPSGPSGRRPDDDFPSLPNYMPPSHVPSIRAKELKQFGGSSLASSIADNTLVKPTSKIATVTSLDNFGAGSQQQGKPSSSSKANFMTDEFPSLPVNEKKSKKKKKPIAEATPVNSSKGSSHLVKNVKSSPEKLTLASLAASTVAVGTNNKGKESASQNNNGRNKKEDHNIRKEEPTKLPLEADNKLDYPGLVSTEKPKKPKAAPPGLTTAAKKSPPGFGPTENGLGKAPPGFPNGSKKPAPKPPSSGQANELSVTQYSCSANFNNVKRVP